MRQCFVQIEGTQDRPSEGSLEYYNRLSSIIYLDLSIDHYQLQRNYTALPPVRKIRCGDLYHTDTILVKVNSHFRTRNREASYITIVCANRRHSKQLTCTKFNGIR